MSDHRQADWQRHARCRGISTEIFFVADGARGSRKAGCEERAKRICRMCPVRRECLHHAVAAGEPHGIWGAMTPTERVAISMRTSDSEPEEAGANPARSRHCDRVDAT